MVILIESTEKDKKESVSFHYIVLENCHYLSGEWRVYKCGRVLINTSDSVITLTIDFSATSLRQEKWCFFPDVARISQMNYFC